MKKQYPILAGQPINQRQYREALVNVRNSPVVDSYPQFDIPHGWIYVVSEMLDAVLPMLDSLPERFLIGNIRKHSDGRMSVGSPNATMPLKGVLRKFSRKAASTCEKCGSTGRLQPFKTPAVLCPACVAKDLLSFDLDAVDVLVHQHRALPWVDITEVPPALRKSFRTWVDQNQGYNATGRIEIWHLHEWAAHLRVVSTRLKEAAKKSKVGE